MRRVLLMLLVCLLGVAGAGLEAAPAWAPTSPAFSDVGSGHWAYPAVKYVAADRDWLRDFGPNQFRPDSLATRKQVARGLTRAFAPNEKANVVLKDLPQSDPAYPQVAVAIAHGWFAAPDGVFAPQGTVTKLDLDRALSLALGLTKELSGLDRISTADGMAIAHSKDFPALSIGNSLGLWRNYPNEARELLPSSAIRRADAAWALWRAATAQGTYRITALQRFRSMTLPAMAPERRAVVEFALSYVGYPYVYAGEWPAPAPKGASWGSQPQGGFDCSGFVWWVLRAPGGGYDPTVIRPYRGWDLPERSSFDMARQSIVRLTPDQLLPGDLMLDAMGSGTDWRSIDHVGIALGSGWMIHSSSPGVVIEWVGDGWWKPRFRWGRRVIPDMSGSATGGEQAGDASWQDGSNPASPAPTR